MTEAEKNLHITRCKLIKTKLFAVDIIVRVGFSSLVSRVFFTLQCVSDRSFANISVVPF